MTQNKSERTGGCLCGAVRYRAQGDSLWVAHCHCESCRRAASAPFVTWIGYNDKRFTITKSAPRRYASAPDVIRTFCADCGSPLTYQSQRWPGEVHVLAASLDDPASVQPQRHVYYGEHLPWIALDDALPRHDTTSTASAAET